MPPISSLTPYIGLAVALWLAPALAQGPIPPIPAAPPRAENRAPVGEPTTYDNRHLPTEGEVRLGREVAAQIESQFKIIRYGAQYDRLQRVARDIIRAAQSEAVIEEFRRLYGDRRINERTRRVPFEFSVRLVEEDQMVNAISLAGGIVYVTTGLMNDVTSDDELAGVLAHELVHTVYHHVEQHVQKQRKASSKQIWAALITVLAGFAGGGEVAAAAGQLMIGYQLVNTAALSGFSRELETEADRAGVLLMTKTPYNPVGLLTFMQKLAVEDRRAGYPDLGIYQSHPFTNERVDALAKELVKRGYTVTTSDLRQASGRFRVSRRTVDWRGKPAIELRLVDARLMLVADLAGAPSLEERAGRIARGVEQMLESGASFNDVKIDLGRGVVLIRGLPVIEITPGDAEAGGGLAGALKQAETTIHRALLREELETG